MWFNSGKEERMDVPVTPQDYILALEEGRYKDSVAKEVAEAREQILSFTKRENDFRIITYREFIMDDDLTRANMVVDGMWKTFYTRINKIVEYVKVEEEESTRKQKVRKLLCKNDMVLADLNKLLTKVLLVQEKNEDRSLSHIQDTIRTMEKVYINQLTTK